MKRFYLILLLTALFISSCQKKEEEVIDFGKIGNMEEEESIEWSLPLKVVLDGEDFMEEVVLFEKESYGESLR